MIDRDRISELVAEKLNENIFLVDLRVSADNVIQVEIDSFRGLTIDQCVEMSRHIESHLDRETEDFELRVSSPGIDQYFKVNQQFMKNVGREVDVVTRENLEYRGLLDEATEEGIVLEVLVKEKMEGQNKPHLTAKKIAWKYEDIKKAKVVISFK